MRTRFLSLVIGVSLLSVVSWQQLAHSQETKQEEITRKLKTRVEPRYPDLARKIHAAGKVKVVVTISPNGYVKDTHVIGGNPILANAALDAIRQWRFEASPKETTEAVEIEFKDSKN